MLEGPPRIADYWAMTPRLGFGPIIAVLCLLSLLVACKGDTGDLDKFNTFGNKSRLKGVAPLSAGFKADLVTPAQRDNVTLPRPAKVWQEDLRMSIM